MTEAHFDLLCQAIYMLEGDNCTLGDAYWAIHAISEYMDRLDENHFVLMSGDLETLQVCHGCCAVAALPLKSWNIQWLHATVGIVG